MAARVSVVAARLDKVKRQAHVGTAAMVHRADRGWPVLALWWQAAWACSRAPVFPVRQDSRASNPARLARGAGEVVVRTCARAWGRVQAAVAAAVVAAAERSAPVASVAVAASPSRR